MQRPLLASTDVPFEGTAAGSSSVSTLAVSVIEAQTVVVTFTLNVTVLNDSSVSDVTVPAGKPRAHVMVTKSVPPDCGQTRFTPGNAIVVPVGTGAETVTPCAGPPSLV